jgi:cell division protein FtsN
MNQPRKTLHLSGFLGGLLTGLAIAAALAVYLTNAPVPFVNKVQRPTENITPDAGDPNRSLFSPHIPGPAAPAAEKPAGAATPPAAAPAPRAAEASPEEAADGPRQVLQVGAFRSSGDADTLRARLALLGLDAQISTAQQGDGQTWFRVRLGPYGALDDLNGIRRTLSENGMSPQLVRVR